MAKSTTYISQANRPLLGDVDVPGDKSISHRSIIFGALAEGTTHIRGFLEGQDSLATLNAFRQMGVQISDPKQGELTIQGVGLHGLQAPPSPLDLGNSGTSIRILSGLLAGQNFNTELFGDSSLNKRPMARVIKPLIEMGAEIKARDNNYPPLQIFGKRQLHGITYAMPIASAQVKSCLLMAGLYAQGQTCIIQSKVSRDHTERMLLNFGGEIQRFGSKLCIQSDQKLQACEVTVPKDISSAAFFIVAAAIIPGSEIYLRDVGMNPTRKGIIDILLKMGADISTLNHREVNSEPIADIHVRHSHLNGIEIPGEQISLAIDEFPIIFIAAACAEGRTTLRGAQELRVKESDRIAVMAEGLIKLGIKATILEDGLIIEGGKLSGGRVNSYGDHRIAMSFSVAGQVAEQAVIIDDCANVGTSFPGFVSTAQKVGFDIEEVDDVD